MKIHSLWLRDIAKQLVGLLKNRIVSNMGWMVISAVGQMILSVVINSFVARYLGPSNYGVIYYVSSIMSIFIPVCQLGLYSIVISEIVTNPNNRGEIIGSALSIRLVLGTLSSFATIFLVTVLQSFDQVYMLAAVLCSIKLVFDAFDILKYWYQSQLQYKKVAIISIIAYLCMSAFRIILLAKKSNIYWFSFATSLDSIIIAIGLALVYKLDFSPKMSISKKRVFRLMQQSKNLFFASIIAGLSSQINTVLLSHYVSETSVGYYACAVTINAYLAFVFGAVIDSLRPSIIDKFKQSRELYHSAISVVISIVTLMSIAFVVFITIFARPMVLLLYGEEFLPAVSISKFYSVGFCLSYYGVIRTIWFVCENKMQYERNISILSSIISILFSFLFTSIWGLAGAVISYIFQQILRFVLMNSVYKQTRNFQALFLRGIRFQDLNKIKNIFR